MVLALSEIFHSIQGESSHAGRPCTFIRLTGCNLRCAWCDTQYSWEGGQAMSLDEVLGAVAGHGCKLVEITGGEPLAQEQTPELVRRLLDAGYEVLVETNGTFAVDVLDKRAVAIVDVKCPSSGMHERMDLGSLAKLRPHDELKFVIADRADFDYAAGVVRTLPVTPRHILFSPIMAKLAPADLAAWIVESRLPVRLGLQLHKLIWDPEERGV